MVRRGEGRRAEGLDALESRGGLGMVILLEGGQQEVCWKVKEPSEEEMKTNECWKEGRKKERMRS